MIGVLNSRLPDVGLHATEDPRRKKSTKWGIGPILNVVVAAMVAGCKSLDHLESLTNEMSVAARGKLGLKRRLPDTTVRDLLVRVEPMDLRKSIYRQVRAAHRRKALACDELPFGVVAMDGKMTAIDDVSGCYVQERTGINRNYGLVRTVTSSLISSSSKICLDASPIPHCDNEQSHYEVALEELLSAYGSLNLFKLVTYDAGACSQWNAWCTREMGLHYLMRVKEKSQPKLSAHIKKMASGAPVSVHEETVSGQLICRSIFLCEQAAVWRERTQLKTVVRIVFERFDNQGELTETQERLYATSLAENALTPKQWITVTRNHWNVENNCHHTFDAVFREDERPWISANGQGTLAVLLLRRVAYNILTMFRSVTLRSKANRLSPWRTLGRRFYNALISSTEHQLKDMRIRKPPEVLIE
jgi:predicted transposase YbfD/YdcC